MNKTEAAYVCYYREMVRDWGSYLKAIHIGEHDRPPRVGSIMAHSALNLRQTKSELTWAQSSPLYLRADQSTGCWSPMHARQWPHTQPRYPGECRRPQAV